MTRPLKKPSRFLPKKRKNLRALPAARLGRICETLERRELLTVGVNFLQGTVTLSGAPQAGATIQVTDISTPGPALSTTTDSNGYYLFTGLTPGDTYKITEAAPTGYTNSSAQANETPAGINQVGPITASSITVTLGTGPSYLHFDSVGAGLGLTFPGQNISINIPAHTVTD
ncbi:MAG TPA: carboxypeptidase regulatory-like domain-containing protein, partial [Pirellulales bacterium]|nr:carboxypeptidase regulatory-like domain-containing protein [Pirellulales bacterium]